MFRSLPFLACSVCVVTAAAAAQDAPEWKPEAGVVARLAPVTDAGPFRIRPPKGYRMSREQGPPGSDVFGWVGAERRDGSRPYLMVMGVSPPAGKRNTYTPESALDRSLSALQEQRSEWKRTETEKGKINGVPFVRAYWSGKEPERKVKMRGFAYLTIDGERIIQINSQDVEPHAEDALKLAEAAALTFQKR